MADFNCPPNLCLLYPSILLLLFFSSISHPPNFFSHLSVVVSNLTTTGHEAPFSSVTQEYYLNNPRKKNSTNIVKVKSKFGAVEEGLARARAAIREASLTRNYTSHKEERFVPRGSIYINPYAFHQSHIEMEKRFKVWTYKEGEKPLFHDGPMNNIYGIEGQMIDELESGKSPFAAKHPDEATAFFIPVSIVGIVKYVYRPYTSFLRDRLQNVVKDYITAVSTRYPYWNRSSGADHFLISCHDWAPDVSAADPELYKHFIRVLCNANSSEGFVPSRDVSLPEIFLPYANLGPPQFSKPPEHHDRPILAFFAGGEHGYVRKAVLNHWKGKGKDVQVYGYLPQTLNYTELMSQSKYCLCPSGWEVASPRVVESMHAACVPVIISDNYVLPFRDVLDWSKFSVHIPVAKIPEIKSILQRIPVQQYLDMQKRVFQVQRHFVMNRPSKPYDVMHMVMHSVWLRRLNRRVA